MNQPWLRAGLIGAGAVIVVNLLSLVPVLNCLSLPLQLLVLAGVGVLAASFMAPRRESGRAAGQGALAGLVTGLVGGIAAVIMASIGFATAGGSQALLSALPPEILQQYSQMGIDPSTILTSGAVTSLVAACCLPGSLLGGALLGALGGLVFAAAKPD